MSEPGQEKPGRGPVPRFGRDAALRGRIKGMMSEGGELHGVLAGDPPRAFLGDVAIQATVDGLRVAHDAEASQRGLGPGLTKPLAQRLQDGLKAGTRERDLRDRLEHDEKLGLSRDEPGETAEERAARIQAFLDGAGPEEQAAWEQAIDERASAALLADVEPFDDVDADAFGYGSDVA